MAEKAVVTGTADELVFAVKADKDNVGVLITTIRITTKSLSNEQLAQLGKLESLGATFSLEQLQAKME